VTAYRVMEFGRSLGFSLSYHCLATENCRQVGQVADEDRRLRAVVVRLQLW
jgi:hypothetical protein